MNAKEIFEKLVERASCWGLFSSGRRSGKPGELIEKLPPEEREELQNLSSKDVGKMEDRHVLNYMIGQYPESSVTVHKIFPNQKDEEDGS